MAVDTWSSDSESPRTAPEPGDETVVTFALPSAQGSLGFSSHQRQSIVTASTLAFGSMLLLGGGLTEFVSWPAVMDVNVVIAVVAVTGALALLHNQVSETKLRLDVPGAITVSAGMFAAVFGFSHAETTSWGILERSPAAAAAVTP